MRLPKQLLAISVLTAATTGAAQAEWQVPAANSSKPSAEHANHDHAAHQAEMRRAISERQAEVAKRSRPVMGFDLDRTLHDFAPTSGGGVLTVTSRDGDAVQVGRVRSHLEYQTEAFRRGDWANPIQIHGAEMPGLSELIAARGKLKIDYQSIAAGGRITFVSSNKEVTLALHRWFDAQNSDHGKHAGH